MVEEKNNIQRQAMLFGTYMGIFWMLKFVLFPLGMTIPFLAMAFILLTLAVPFLGLYYARMYRNRFCGGGISIGQAFIFTWMMYLFASLLAALIHYIYFAFIDNGFVINQCEAQIVVIEQTNMPGMEETIELLKESLNNIKSLSAIDITMQLLSQNAFIALLMAIPTALLVAKRVPPQSVSTDEGNNSN